MTVSVGWIDTVVFTAVVDTGFSWTLSGLVACFSCRHQRTYVPSTCHLATDPQPVIHSALGKHMADETSSVS